MTKIRSIRKAKTCDVKTVLRLIDCGRNTMIASGNTHQWDANHPSRKQIEEDVANGDSYLLFEDDKPIDISRTLEYTTSSHGASLSLFQKRAMSSCGWAITFHGLFVPSERYDYSKDKY